MKTIEQILEEINTKIIQMVNRKITLEDSLKRAMFSGVDTYSEYLSRHRSIKAIKDNLHHVETHLFYCEALKDTLLGTDNKFENFPIRVDENEYIK
jgi:hypothetical protein